MRNDEWHAPLIRRKEAKAILSVGSDHLFDAICRLYPGFAVRFKPGGYALYSRTVCLEICKKLEGARYGRVALLGLGRCARKLRRKR